MPLPQGIKLLGNKEYDHRNSFFTKWIDWNLPIGNNYLPLGYPDYNFATMGYPDVFLTNDKVVVLEPSLMKWEELGVMIQFFDSKGTARKSGWSGPIPNGWLAFKVGKGINEKYVFIWNEGLKTFS